MQIVLNLFNLQSTSPIHPTFFCDELHLMSTFTTHILEIQRHQFSKGNLMYSQKLKEAGKVLIVPLRRRK